MGKLLASCVMPAIMTDEELPANPEGLSRLEARIREAAIPPEPGPVPPLPPTAERVSGRSISVDDNPMGVETMTLTFGEGEAEALLGVGFQGGMGFEWAIGLDGVPRISPGLYGLPLAATGTWKSDDVFVVDIDHLGNRDRERISATFSDGQVGLHGFDVPLVGQLGASDQGIANGRRCSECSSPGGCSATGVLPIRGDVPWPSARFRA